MASIHSRAHLPTTILPTVRYRELGPAVAWLERAFDFQVRSIEVGADGHPSLAHMMVGNASLLLASADAGCASNKTEQLQDADHPDTQSCYVVVPDISAHFKRAVAAGSTLVVNLHDTPQSNRYYSCRDCEGHIWTFGVIDPTTEVAGEKRSRVVSQKQTRSPARVLSLAVGLLVMIATSVAAGWKIGSAGLPLKNPLADILGMSELRAPTAEQKSELAKVTSTSPDSQNELSMTSDGSGVKPVVINDDTNHDRSVRSRARYKARIETFRLVRPNSAPDDAAEILRGPAGTKQRLTARQPAVNSGAVADGPVKKKAAPPAANLSAPHMSPMLSRCGEMTEACRENSTWCSC